MLLFPLFEDRRTVALYLTERDGPPTSKTESNLPRPLTTRKCGLDFVAAFFHLLLSMFATSQCHHPARARAMSLICHTEASVSNSDTISGMPATQ